MSSIKRLYEEILEHEDAIIELIAIAKEKRPSLYESVKASPNLIKGNLLFSNLTDNKNLARLATFYLSIENSEWSTKSYTNFKTTPEERL